MEHPLIGLAGIVIVGIAAQWLSWRLRLPAIFLLLLAGFVAGGVTGWIDPDELLGAALFPIVSLSVAIILFEGGLSLDIAELAKIGRVVRNLASIGVVATWVLSAIAARFLLGFDWPLSALLGAILVVTGPTVIIPLLRHIRPTANSARRSAGRRSSTILLVPSSQCWSSMQSSWGKGRRESQPPSWVW